MNESEFFREGLQYSDEVINAVRYGYEYRKESEKYSDPQDGWHVHHCLPDPSGVLLWLAKKVLDGLIFDAFKGVCKKLYQQLTNSETPLSKQVNNLLTDEHELQQFYDYVKEFNEGCMAVTEKQFKYIRDEIRADYYAKEVSKIMDSEGRLPTHEEYLRIFKEENEYADSLMKLKNVDY